MNDTNSREKIGTVVGVDGVILSSLYEGDKIITPKQNDYRMNYDIDFNQKGAFVKVYTSPLISLFKDLSIREYAIAMALIPFISYKDGALRYDGVIMNSKSISELLGIDYDYLKRVMASLSKKGVIKRTDCQIDESGSSKTQKGYVVNPYIFLRGTDIKKSIVDIFRDTKWAHMI